MLISESININDEIVTSYGIAQKFCELTNDFDSLNDENIRIIQDFLEKEVYIYFFLTRDGLMSVSLKEKDIDRDIYFVNSLLIRLIGGMSHLLKPFSDIDYEKERQLSSRLNNIRSNIEIYLGYLFNDISNNPRDY